MCTKRPAGRSRTRLDGVITASYARWDGLEGPGPPTGHEVAVRRMCAPLRAGAASGGPGRPHPPACRPGPIHGPAGLPRVVAAIVGRRHGGEPAVQRWLRGSVEPHGWPVVSVPSGLDAAGPPVGAPLVAPPGRRPRPPRSRP